MKNFFSRKNKADLSELEKQEYQQRKELYKLGLGSLLNIDYLEHLNRNNSWDVKNIIFIIIIDLL